MSKSPAQRAAEAAEALAAQGHAVTARAVKQTAKVMTDVAAAAAREWNETQASRMAVPDAPSAWTARVDALWPEAYRVAHQAFDDERSGLLARLTAAEAERDETAADLDRVEAERDQARREIVSMAEEVREARAAEVEAQRLAAEAHAAAQVRVAAAEGQAEGLRQALAQMGQGDSVNNPAEADE